MRYFSALPATAFLAFFSTQAFAAVTLENDLWKINVEPETLALSLTPKGEAAVQVSSGVESHPVENLRADSASASWNWGGSAYVVTLALDGRDLRLSIEAEKAGTITFITQPASAMGNGFMLPRAEGYYVPAGDTLWRDFILERFSPVDTSQDMSLPLLGLDHGTYTLNWIWETPFNNSVTFADDDATGSNGLSARFEHEFTALDPAKQLKMILHLGDADPLAGAKRYRQWLNDTGQYEPLSNKLSKADEGEKILGASHIYLWGGGLLGAGDVADWPRFISLLQSGKGLAKDIWSRFQKDTLTELKAMGNRPNRYQQRIVIADFNAALNTLARQGWQVEEPDWAAMPQLYAGLRAEVTALFGTALKQDTKSWGDGVAKATFETLKQGGLEKAWIGLGEGWEGGLWHPEAIRSGTEAGYLIAPYDSYQTALPLGGNPDFTTAVLGKRANEECAIIQADGKPKAGFQKNGHYTSAACMRPALEARVSAIKSAVPFNSWFLDAYATGMVFDSYRPGNPLTMAQGAKANVEASRWVAETFSIPAGSEDGNATTSGAIAFAHGMQIPVMGWGDEDLQKNRKSPYFLGGWYPSREPTLFFKKAPMKEPYRTVYFDPKTRLPLYQTVFHGSVITTNHWLYDTLKLTNVRAEMELAQLLYNVPPLFHLSADTLDERLPKIARQAAFFQPLHEAAGGSALTDFRVLSDDRLLQETRFESGLRLIANFALEPRRAEAFAIPAQSIIAVQDGNMVSSYSVAAD